MEFRKSFVILFVLVGLSFLVSAGFAQNEGPSGGKEANTLSLPYIGEITGDNVHIRAGKGTQYYSCAKLNKADKVKVVAIWFTWSRIVPPKGTFSWISTRYVNVDSSNPAVGIVTGDAVGVYAGSADGNPIHSTKVQVRLNKGERVHLLGEERDEYYKILPPGGAYLWVSSEYIRAIAPTSKRPVVVKPKTEVKNTVAKKENVVGKIPTATDNLAKYYELTRQIKLEKAKPIAEQNYSGIKKALTRIAEDKNAGKAARYAEFTLKNIKRCELAIAVDKELRLQNAQLQRTRGRIDKARSRRLEQIVDLGQFVVVGTFKKSSVYGHQPQVRHYCITDASDKLICYSVPVGALKNKDLSGYIGKKVGLTGVIQPHPQTSGALVRFSKIVVIEQ